MKLRKQNSSLWYALGLALLLTLGSLAASTGTALARYRAQTEVVIPFTVRAPEKVYLGTYAIPEGGTEAVFTLSDAVRTEDSQGNVQLSFVAANGASAEDFRANDQQVRVRLIGSLGLWGGSEPTKVTLSVPKAVTMQTEDPDTANSEETAGSTDEAAGTQLQYESYTAVATAISKDSALGKTFGEGWIFTFHETEEVTADGMTQTVIGEELSWTLKGGSFSAVEMKVTVANTTLENTSLLKLQVTGE